MTATKTEKNLIEHLDFDPDIGCEWSEPQCYNSAEWLVINKCCRFTMPTCGYHKKLWVVYVLHMIKKSFALQCGHCNLVKKNVKILSDIVEVQPMKGTF